MTTIEIGILHAMQAELHRLRQVESWANRAKVILLRLEHLPKALRRIADLLEEMQKIPPL